jgi:dTDP-4-amino-4,6-dideoxygalactose transaminase
MGRDALALAINLLGLQADDPVLLPAYVCREVVKPFLTRARVHFYDIRSDLSIDLDYLESILKETKPKVLLIVNYFGFLQPGRDELKRICFERGIVLIEDCAHSLFSDGSGSVGDIVLHSFRKHIPLPDGGGLQVNGSQMAQLTDFYPRIYSNVLSILSTLKSRFAARVDVFSRSAMTSGANQRASNGTNACSQRRILPLSSFARKGIESSNRSEITRRWQSDFEYWREFVSKNNLALTPLFTDLPSNVCPLGFAVRSPCRELLKGKLAMAGIPIKSYWHLHSAVAPEFRTSHELAREVLTLPLGPEVGEGKRDLAATILAGERSPALVVGRCM